MTGRRALALVFVAHVLLFLADPLDQFVAHLPGVVLLAVLWLPPYWCVVGAWEHRVLRLVLLATLLGAEAALIIRVAQSESSTRGLLFLWPPLLLALEFTVVVAMVETVQARRASP